ncbi:uncharacterized protein VP01_4363g1 [Puccinia sorghi]|uniref:Uncharacterized protein n=1 Tax=Puccinia sorghi TaxID=27349 RepID=A0A0L6UQM2_9BASI|nr:uncharacterized protein VP01_4363g1 [Puccinia sorghi]
MHPCHIFAWYQSPSSPYNNWLSSLVLKHWTFSKKNNLLNQYHFSPTDDTPENVQRVLFHWIHGRQCKFQLSARAPDWRQAQAVRELKTKIEWIHVLPCPSQPKSAKFLWILLALPTLKKMVMENFCARTYPGDLKNSPILPTTWMWPQLNDWLRRRGRDMYRETIYLNCAAVTQLLNL